MTEPPGLLRRVARLFRPYHGRWRSPSSSIFATSVLGVANPLLTKVLFDKALFPPGQSGPNYTLLFELVALMIVLPIVAAGIGIFQTYLTTVVGQRVMLDLRNRLYAHLQSMTLRFFTSTRTGELQSRLQNDVGGIQNVVTNTASSVLSNLVMVLSSLIAMLLLSWQLTLLALGLVPFFVYLTYRVGRARAGSPARPSRPSQSFRPSRRRPSRCRALCSRRCSTAATTRSIAIATRTATSPRCRSASRWSAAPSSPSCTRSSPSPPRSSTSSPVSPT